MHLGRFLTTIVAGVLILTAGSPAQQHGSDLSTSKALFEPVPGAPQRTNSLPVTVVLSPDGRYLALLNNG